MLRPNFVRYCRHHLATVLLLLGQFGLRTTERYELAFLQTLMDAIPLPVFYKMKSAKLWDHAAYEALVGMGGKMWLANPMTLLGQGTGRNP